MNGTFLVIEGGEGAGKSTLVNGLKDALEKMGSAVLVTKEPYDQEIRKRLLTESLNAEEQLALFLQDRKAHIEHVIQPALDAGNIVICDRFSPSTIAYQCGGEGLDLEMVGRLDAEARGGLWPDKILLLDGSPVVFKERVFRRGAVLTTYERKPSDYHQRIRASFLAQAQADLSHWCIINAEKNEADVLIDALACLDPLMKALEH
ncbi:MAG: dTMP kinase [Candidatus Niyogibacteria bacterium]|nr:dTMP kinase [Candidatus Niyogibacteria bacterium]